MHGQYSFLLLDIHSKASFIDRNKKTMAGGDGEETIVMFSNVKMLEIN